jgi:hypothetical protein
VVTNFDRLVEGLQQQVLEDTRTAYSDKVSLDRRRSREQPYKDSRTETTVLFD